jgi:hypothetical protein
MNNQRLCGVGSEGWHVGSCDSNGHESAAGWLVLLMQQASHNALPLRHMCHGCYEWHTVRRLCVTF